MADGGIMEAALLGAAMGGGSAALTGGDPLKGALVGGLTGGAGGAHGQHPDVDILLARDTQGTPGQAQGVDQ